MADHRARARAYRRRAVKCEDVAKITSSAKFSNCYLLLARHYAQLAELEEDFFRRSCDLQYDALYPASGQAV